MSVVKVHVFAIASTCLTPVPISLELTELTDSWSIFWSWSCLWSVPFSAEL